MDRRAATQHNHTANPDPPERSRSNAYLLSCAVAVVATTIATALVPPLVAGVPAKDLAFAALATLSGILALGLAGNERADPDRDRIQFGLTVALVAALVASANARFPDAALVGVLPYAALAMLYFAAARVFREVRTSVVAAGVQIAAGTVVACCGIAGYRAFLAARATGEVGDSARATFLATPFFEHAYLAAQLVSPLVPLAIGLCLARSGARTRLAVGGAALLLTTFVVVTASRAAAVALVIGSVAVLLTAPRSDRAARPDSKRLPRRTVLGLLAAVALVALVLITVGSRFASLFDPRAAFSNFQRVLLWTDTLRLVTDAPWTGIGPGHFGFFIGEYHRGSRPLSHAHDQVLHTLTEIGVVGLFGLVLAGATTIVSGRRKRVDPTRAAIAAGYLGAFVTIIVLGITETPLAFPAGAAMFAIVTAAIGASREETDATPRAASLVRWITPSVALVAIGFSFSPTLDSARAGHFAHDAGVARSRGDLDEARNALGRAVALAPSMPELRALLAALEDDAGDTEAALESWRAYDRLTPGLPDALVHIAALEMRAGRPDRAIAPLSYARRRAPEESRLDLEIELATALHRARRFEAARLAWIRLVSSSAQLVRPIVLLRLAETLVNLKRERSTVVSLLSAYQAVVSEPERAYPRQLYSDLAKWYGY